MSKIHEYQLAIVWTGNQGVGTTRYDAYERSHTVSIDGKVDILASSDTPFRGDSMLHNPEDMLLAALSSCHMLWYLHLCADAGVIVTAYSDKPRGKMIQLDNGGGHFEEVMLHPIVTVQDAAMIDQANALHDIAHQKCFIANSVNFLVTHSSSCVLQ
jgi:organic hydroperoxide reductase OsmC/OhrA